MTVGEAQVLAIEKLLMGRRPLIYLHTYEEPRAREFAKTAFRKLYKREAPSYNWSITTGLLGVEEPLKFCDPLEVLRYIQARSSPGLFFLSDFHSALLENPSIIRTLREIYHTLLQKDVYIFFLSGVKEIPPEADNEIAYYELEPPSLEELQGLILQNLPHYKGEKLTEKELAVAGRTLQGLTYNEARHALLAAFASSKEKRELITNLQQEKKLQVRKQGLVEYIPELTPFKHIGGLAKLKDWLIKRKSLMHLEGAFDKEIIPKGILLMGISGCGKSLSVKAIASLWELPLYRLDMVRVYSGIHGKPEEAFIRACETMEKISPAVLWIDEIEMGIQLGESQEGVASRIFGFFLTWMQEKKEGLFLAATANRINLLPAEILRRGRFDQIFFIDLPQAEERREIFKIHLSRRGFEPDSFDLDLLVDLTDGCNGAEIEQCVISALVEAKIAEREPTQKDLISAKRLIVPLSKTMGEQIRRIKQWAFNKATPAS